MAGEERDGEGWRMEGRGREEDQMGSAGTEPEGAGIKKRGKRSVFKKRGMGMDGARGGNAGIV